MLGTVAQHLRMPLHPEHVRRALDFDRLDGAVFGPPDRAGPVAQPLDGLMVQCVDSERRAAQRGGDAALGIETDVVNRLVVRVVARVDGHVLHERAAQRDVEHLDAAAYAERRLVAFDERSAERDLGVVAAGIERAG